MMQQQHQALFERIYQDPSDAYMRLLNKDVFPWFIAYLYEKDGRFAPTVSDGKGDGGVDIELRTTLGNGTFLLGIAQCKYHLVDKVGPRPIGETCPGHRYGPAIQSHELA